MSMSTAPKSSGSLILEMQSELTASAQPLTNQISQDKWQSRQSRALWMRDNIQIQSVKKKKNRGWCATERDAEEYNTWALNKNEKLITLYWGCG